jgi:hypothetical protein
MRQADKITLLIVGALASIAFTAPFADAQTFEPNTNRAGSDYRVIDLSNADSQLCQQACLGDDVCRAWTYVQPGLQGPAARCWLKNAVPAPMAADCCTSGVKGGAAANAATTNTASADQSGANGDDQNADTSGDDGPGGGGGRGLKLRRNPNNPNGGIKLRNRDGNNPNGQQANNGPPGQFPQNLFPQNLPPDTGGSPTPASAPPSGKVTYICMRDPDGKVVKVTETADGKQDGAGQYCMSGGSLNGKCGQVKTHLNTSDPLASTLEFCINGSCSSPIPASQWQSLDAELKKKYLGASGDDQQIPCPATTTASSPSNPQFPPTLFPQNLPPPPPQQASFPPTLFPPTISLKPARTYGEHGGSPHMCSPSTSTPHSASASPNVCNPKSGANKSSTESNHTRTTSRSTSGSTRSSSTRNRGFAGSHATARSSSPRSFRTASNSGRGFGGGGGGFHSFGGGGFHGGGGHRSDIRLKDDIVPLGRLANGIGLYRFRYKDEDRTLYVGVMAQEVQNVVPRAVSRDRDGYLRVDYDRLGISFMTWDDYRAHGGRDTQ